MKKKSRSNDKIPEDEMTKKIKTKKRYVIVGNQSYGLYYGQTDATDGDIAETKSVRIEGCRHICHWRGKTGGITSLAAFGPCGPKVAESRIGAPAPSALVMGVVNVFDVSAEAVKAFAKIEASNG